MSETEADPYADWAATNNLPNWDDVPPGEAPEVAEDIRPASDQRDSEQRRQPQDDKQPWRAMDLRSLHGVPVPERRWIVPNWLPVRQVTLLYADGGIGKTLLGLQLMASAALGLPWCGVPVTPCKSVGIFSEDDANELHIRLEAIRDHHNATFPEMADMCPIDATGQDNTLVHFEGSRMILTPRFHRLREHALDIGARLIPIDTAATTFGGNENDRAQVTAFVGGALTRLAQDTDGAVLLMAHPSLSGISSGDLRSGSTGWNNSCRSRWAMTRPLGEDGKPMLDSPERVLTRQKANGAATGEVVPLRWENGVFVRPGGLAGAPAGARKDLAEAAFLAALRARTKEGLHASQSAHAASNYAPKVFALMPEGRDFRKQELREAMDNLLMRGRIRTVPYRKNSQDHEHLVIVGENA